MKFTPWVLVIFLLVLLIYSSASQTPVGDKQMASLPDSATAVGLSLKVSTDTENIVALEGSVSGDDNGSDVVTGTSADFVSKEEVTTYAWTDASVLGESIEQPSNMYLVTRVIDGDTIEVATLAGVKRVRYIGVDTPETVHPSKPVECFGQEASNKNKALVEGKWVRLEKDISDTDRYGRWLRYVYVDDEFVNLTLVSEGFASVLTYPPDIRYVENFRRAEREAREEGRGLWGSVCSTWVTPVASPTNSSTFPITSQTPPNASCNIKGNINNKGEKIYHYPGCKSYDQTLITEDTGERWFCSEAEAVQAGWRKAGNC